MENIKDAFTVCGTKGKLGYFEFRCFCNTVLALPKKKSGLTILANIHRHIKSCWLSNETNAKKKKIQKMHKMGNFFKSTELAATANTSKREGEANFVDLTGSGTGAVAESSTTHEPESANIVSNTTDSKNLLSPVGIQDYTENSGR